MKRGQEGMSRSRRRRIRGSRVIGSTHVCGSVSGIVPNVVHQGGEVLQAVWDVVRKEQDAHRLRTQSQGSNVASILTSASTENKRMKEDTDVDCSLCSSGSLHLWPWFNVGDVHPQSGLYSISQKVSSLLWSATQLSMLKTHICTFPTGALTVTEILQLIKTADCKWPTSGISNEKYLF